MMMIKMIIVVLINEEMLIAEVTVMLIYIINDKNIS